MVVAVSVAMAGVVAVAIAIVGVQVDRAVDGRAALSRGPAAAIAAIAVPLRRLVVYLNKKKIFK